MPSNRFELLATWYLRFNGYFTTPGFTVHPDSRKAGGGTDADVLAVRFRHSEEYQARYQFERDPVLSRHAEVEFLICEVKAGLCDINEDTWRNPDKKNVEYALRWMGFEQAEAQVDLAAKSIYRLGAWSSSDRKTTVRFVCFGGKPNDGLKATLPRVQFILHPQVIAFLRRRFTMGCVQIARQNWEADIVDFAKRCGQQGVGDAQLLAWARSG